jgi:hypothetical protein
MRIAAGILALAILPIEQLSLPATGQVGESIRQWELSTRIDVSDFSADRLRLEIPRLADQLKIDARGPAGMPQQQYQAFVLDTLTQEYLFWARDRAGGDVTRLGEPTVAPETVNAFLAYLGPAVQGRLVGRLEVSSDPDKAPIEIDGANKGLTQRRFVMSAGTHAVTVSPPLRQACRRLVTIVAGQTATVDCR